MWLLEFCMISSGYLRTAGRRTMGVMMNMNSKSTICDLKKQLKAAEEKLAGVTAEKPTILGHHPHGIARIDKDGRCALISIDYQ